MSELRYPITDRWADLSRCRGFRFLLGRAWMFGEGTALWCLTNPADADEEVDDRTALRVCAFSQRWGFQRALLVNTGPLRSPQPSDHRAWLRAQLMRPGGLAQSPALRANGEAIAAARREADAIVVAWGVMGTIIEREAVKLALRTLGRARLQCLGLTEGGHPKHPLARGRHRVPIDARPQAFQP